MRPRASGYIDRVLFREGQAVKQGETLFVIDPRPYQADYDRAKRRPRAGEIAARARDARSRERAQAEGSGAVSQEELDQRLSALNQQEASVAAAQGRIRCGRLDLSFTKVRAPIDGRGEPRGSDPRQPGDRRQQRRHAAHHDRLASTRSTCTSKATRTLTCATRRWRAQGERQSSRDCANPVRVGLANEEGFPHEGRMDFVDNQLNVRTGTIRARAVLDNKEGRFTPGMFARVQLLGSGEHEAVLIEERAIGTDQTQTFVLVLGADNKLEYRPVRAGAQDPGTAHRRQGLESRRESSSSADCSACGLACRSRPSGRRWVCRRRRLATADDPAMNISSFFIDRPIFASVISIIIVVAGLVAMPLLPVSEYPGGRAAHGGGGGQLPRGVPDDDRRNRHYHARAADQRRRERALYQLLGRPRRRFTITVTFRLGTNLDDAQVQTQNRVTQARAAPAGGRAPDRPRDAEALAGPHDGRVPALARSALRLAVPAQLRGDPDPGRSGAAARAWAKCACSVRATTRCGCGWIRERSRPRSMTVDEVLNAVREQNAEVAAGRIGGQPALPGTSSRTSSTRRDGSGTEAEFGNIIIKTGDTGDVVYLRDVARIELGPETYACAACSTARRRSAFRSSSCPARMHSSCRTKCARTMDGAVEAVSRKA